MNNDVRKKIIDRLEFMVNMITYRSEQIYKEPDISDILALNKKRKQLIAQLCGMIEVANISDDSKYYGFTKSFNGQFDVYQVTISDKSVF